MKIVGINWFIAFWIVNLISRGIYQGVVGIKANINIRQIPSSYHNKVNNENIRLSLGNTFLVGLQYGV